jgi:ppGpp synthetase/RelA/SpoT-type nucleotidyltranferase
MQKAATNIKAELARLEPIHKQLKEETIFILESILKEAGIKHHSLSGRIKTPESTIEKLKRKQLTKPQQLNDLVGVRIVCLFLSDIKKIGDLIRGNFEVEEEDNKIEDQDLASFGYMSFHFITKIKKTHSGPRYDTIRNFPAEIQVRTIAMDAWAATSHYLDYKSEQDVPKELRKDFFALSGLFYVADQHFEMFFKSRLKSKKIIAQDFAKEPTGPNVELNLDTLQEYLKTRFPTRSHDNAYGLSGMVKELNDAGYRTIEEVEKVVSKAFDVVLKLEKETLHPPQFKMADVGVVRAALDLCDNKYFSSRSMPPEHREIVRKYRKLLTSR